MKQIKTQQEEINRKMLEFGDFDVFTPQTIKKIKEEYGPTAVVSKKIELGEDLLPIKEKAYKVYKHRTTFNYSRIITEIILFDSNHFPRLFKEEVGNIEHIETNNAVTVVKVYWTYPSLKTRSSQLTKEEKKDILEITERLNKYGQARVAPRIFTKLGLKRPVEVRFIFSDKGSLQGMGNETLKKAALQQSMEIIKRKITEGVISKEDVTSQMVVKYYDAQFKKMQNMMNDSFKYPVKDPIKKELEKTKRVRNHKNEDGSRNRTRKSKKSLEESRSERFWNSLD